MKAIGARFALFVSVFALIVLSSGCSTVVDRKLKLKPLQDYPGTAALNVRVVLVLGNEFVDKALIERKPFLTNPGVRFSAAEGLAGSAEAMARALFKDVRVVHRMGDYAHEECNAIIIPRVNNVEEEYTLKGGVFVFLEWTVTRPTGELLWKQTVKGEGTSSQSLNTLCQRALDDAFRNSCQQMSASPEIRALAR